ncbi:MAG TPA: sensor domain-containing diguanylate cyclase [Candidatus Competibacteraceae bacterium]|nr:sensor domain-containing diguanylate cyclase [Candidatus Competibacteraceae bacterium]
MKRHILLLCLGVGLMSLGVLGGGWYFLAQARQEQEAQLLQQTRLAADAFEQHTVRVVSYVDVLLWSLRAAYLRTGSLSEMQTFINEMVFDRNTIDSINIISADGLIVASSRDRTGKPLNVVDREYFQYHRSTPEDRIFISAVEFGRISSRYMFRISRRISNPDGSFAGIVIVAVDAQWFSSYYQSLNIGRQNVAALLGVHDHKLRARAPEPDPALWAVVIESPVWARLAREPVGVYEADSAVDGIRRTYAYRKVSGLPLVLVVGFSVQDMADRLATRRLWLMVAEISVIAVMITLAALLALMMMNRQKLLLAHQELGEAYVKIRELALFDALTGLPNRRLFMDRFQLCLLTAERNGEALALLYVDLDDFKAINDQLGHDAGDEVLREAASRMRDLLRSNDTVCRWGGDEFLILLPNAAGVPATSAIAERLIARITAPMTCDGNPCRVSASVGLALFPEHGREWSALRKAADAALYEAKHRGKCQWVVASCESC